MEKTQFDLSRPRADPPWSLDGPTDATPACTYLAGSTGGRSDWPFRSLPAVPRVCLRPERAVGAAARGSAASKSTQRPREPPSSQGHEEVIRDEILTMAFLRRVGCGVPGEVCQNKSELEMMRFRPSAAVLRLQWVQPRGSMRGQQGR